MSIHTHEAKVYYLAITGYLYELLRASHFLKKAVLQKKKKKINDVDDDDRINFVENQSLRLSSSMS